MSLTGRVKGGVVVLDEPGLPEGVCVRVEVIANGTPNGESLVEGLLNWAGKSDGLPEDLARNHDHYLHGQPKK